MPTQPVAGSREELALLHTLTAKLGDADALGVYNDWLQDQGDPRGDHLGRFLEAWSRGKRLPKRPVGVSRAWEELVGLGVRRRLRERPESVGRLEPHLPTLLDSGRTCLRMELRGLQPMSKAGLGRSRAGGLPDLPAGADWPMCDDELCGGRWPMLFLVQIDLRELAGTVCEGVMPEAGLLSLFFYPENEPRGLELRYTPSDVPLVRTQPPRPYQFHFNQLGVGRFPTSHTRPIRLIEMVRYPYWCEELPEELEEFELADDERLEWVLLGTRAEEQHYFGARFGPNICGQWSSELFFEDVPRTHLELFELAEEERLHWHFVDKLHVFVDRERARKGEFDERLWGTI